MIAIQDNLMRIQRFRSREQARRYAKGAGLKGWKVRMRKDPDHEWANRRGNVPVIQCGSDPGGNLYFFDDGYTRLEYLEGYPKD